MAISAKIFSAPISICRLSCIAARARTSAAKKPRLLESLEGKLGQPRVKPPFPASVGLYNKPTVINNVETLCNVPVIIERGAEWYAKIGTPKSTGPKVFCLSGHVNRPGNYEAPFGSITFRDLIYDLGGGIRNGKKLKAILPAGASSFVVNPAANEAVMDVKLDFEAHCNRSVPRLARRP